VRTFAIWLGGRDSNPDTVVQRAVSTFSCASFRSVSLRFSRSLLLCAYLRVGLRSCSLSLCVSLHHAGEGNGSSALRWPAARHHTLRRALDLPESSRRTTDDRSSRNNGMNEHAPAMRFAITVSEHSVARPLAIPPPRNRSFAVPARQPWPMRMGNQSRTRSETNRPAT